jgi:hypothetical protein
LGFGGCVLVFAIKCRVINMSNFIYAIVATVYALVCLTKETDQGKGATSKSAENSSKKRAEGELEALSLNEQIKVQFKPLTYDK